MSENWFRVISAIRSTDINPQLSGSTRERDEKLQNQFLFQFQFDRILDYAAEICNDLAGKRVVFNTSNGYAGSRPESTTEGDNIAMISGVTFPMVLRKVESDPLKYTIVGPACIHGLTYGSGTDVHDKFEIILV
ncbi:hypothetical protein F5Y19DRAFT_479100 [Xylariaceae sp. FL1651]|nr:hypothetical protein F5Y19DRAFT_479100 [Xylariaceae sp. FL1651]